MGFKEVADLDCEVTTAIGGKNKETGKNNPTSAEGYFIGTRQVPSKKSKTGFCSLHILQTKNGNLGVWGKTNLDQKLLGVEPGTMVRITFVGMVETNANPMYKYRVEQDRDNTIDVSTVTAAKGGQEPEDSTGDDDRDAGGDDDDTDPDLDSDEGAADEAPPARATPPRRAATTPSAERQAKVQALLNGSSRKGA
jgi:hypothetical protein